MSIFLSYASENREIAELITFAMRARGHEVFFDKDDLSAGASYQEKIEKAIKDSRLFIFLISSQSIEQGRYTLTEVALARRQWKNPQDRVLPVMVENVNIDKVPVFLRSVSILQPKGDIAAEVCAEASQILQSENYKDLSPANFLSRCLSSAVDMVFIMLFIFGLFLNIGSDISAIHIFVPTINFFAILGIYIISLSSLSGTPGDRVLKLRVVDETTGETPKLLQSVIWTATYVCLGYIGWIWYFIDSRKRMLHNIMSGTIVVSEAEWAGLDKVESNAYQVFHEKIKQRDFRADLRSFQKLLDEIKPDRVTQYRPSQQCHSHQNSSGWNLRGAADNGSELRFKLKPNEASGHPRDTKWVIGRQKNECNFVVDQNNVSRKHAEVFYRVSEGVSVRDLGSTNGTYINGKQISSKWQALKDGDILSLGSTHLRVSKT